MKSTLPLLFCADSAYQTPLTVALGSALTNLDPGYQLEVTIATPSDDPVSLEGLRSRLPNPEQLQSLRLLKIDPSHLRGLRGNKHLSIATYLRLIALAQMDHSTQVLYLDCDILVLTSLHSLWTTSFSTPVAAVRDGAEALNLRRRHWEAIQPHRPPLTSYFNAGVLLVNLERWKAQQVSRRALTLAHRRGFELCDQDALNVVLRSQVTWLDRRWNWQFHTGKDWMRFLGWDLPSYLRDSKNPRIVHFVNGAKPWAVIEASPLAAKYKGFMASLGFDFSPQATHSPPFAEGTALWALRHCWVARRWLGVAVWAVPGVIQALKVWRDPSRPKGKRSWLAPIPDAP